jgi:ATP-binding cassette subfamily C protein CydD
MQWVSFALMAEKIVLDNAPIETYLGLLALFAFGVLGHSLLSRLQSHYSQKASLNVRNSIRQAMLEKWRKMSPIDLQKQSAGAMATQWVEEVEAMDGYFSRYWPQQMLAVISPFLILCTVAYFNWLCAVLLLISAPLIPLFMVLVGMGAQKLNQKYSTVRQRLAGHFLDRVANLSTIKLLGAQNEVFEEVSQRSDSYRRIIMKTLKVAFLSSTVLEFFTSVAIASLAIYIGFSLYGAISWGPAQSLTLFSGLAILILAPEFFQPLRNLSQYYHDRASALGAAANLASLLDETLLEASKNKDGVLNPQFSASLNKSQSISEADTVSKKCIDNDSNLSEKSVAQASFELTKKSFTLQLQNLSFGYQKEHCLASSLNLSLDTGQLLVISGSSGSGKTSLLNTIARFLPALTGAIDLHPKHNSAMAYLPQKAWIKNDSIYNNLAVLAPKASRQQMHDMLTALGLAAELTQTHAGLDTLIGEHGQGLSGGQMQRIALARVLLNPGSVVLLDEPTAKLDMHSKQFILRALVTLKPNVIMVAASHDPALIELADMHINLNQMSKVKDEILV